MYVKMNSFSSPYPPFNESSTYFIPQKQLTLGHIKGLFHNIQVKYNNVDPEDS